MNQQKTHNIVIHYINGMLSPPQQIENTSSQTKIKKALQSYKQGESQKLILRGLKMREIPQMPSFGSLWENIKLLDLSEMGLKSLRNLPDFKICKKLDCTMNNLNDEEVQNICMKFKAVETVYLTENWIKKKESILMFKDLKCIQELDFTNNPVKYQFQDIFWQFRFKQKFIILDRTDKDGKEIDDFYYSDGDSQDSDFEEDEDEDGDDDDDDESEENSSNSLSKQQYKSPASHQSQKCAEIEEKRNRRRNQKQEDFKNDQCEEDRMVSQ